MTHLKQQTERGFTLVELAIVLIIVGLLIGGILKGQELIQNARVTSTVSQVKGFEAASNTFRDSFGTVPGDLQNADTRLSNCGGSCAPDAANGNGRIDQNPGDQPANESLAAFSQLAGADLINGANATPLDATVNMGDEMPNTDVGGSAFVMGFAPGALTGGIGNGDVTPGTYVVLSSNVGSAIGNGAGTQALTPLDATKMDNKLDDGLPNSGSVRAGGNADGCTDGTDANSEYDGGSGLDCTVFLRIM